jgi:hypothetical protein
MYYRIQPSSGEGRECGLLNLGAPLEWDGVSWESYHNIWGIIPAVTIGYMTRSGLFVNAISHSVSVLCSNNMQTI